MLNDSTSNNRPRKQVKVDLEDALDFQEERFGKLRELQQDIESDGDRDWLNNADNDENDPPGIDPEELDTTVCLPADLEKYIQQAEKHGYKPLRVFHKLRQEYDCLTYGDLKLIGQELGFKPGWCWYRWKEQQEG